MARSLFQEPEFIGFEGRGAGDRPARQQHKDSRDHQGEQHGAVRWDRSGQRMSCERRTRKLSRLPSDRDSFPNSEILKERKFDRNWSGGALCESLRRSLESPGGQSAVS